MKSTWIIGLYHTPRRGSWLGYVIFHHFTPLSFVVILCQQLCLHLSLPWNALMSPMVQCAPSYCPLIDWRAISLSVSRSFRITHHSVSLLSSPQEIEDVNMISHLQQLTFFACVHILWIHSSLEAAIEHYGLKIGKVIGSGVGFTEKDDQSLSVRVWLEAMGLHFWANFMNMHFGVLFTL